MNLTPTERRRAYFNAKRRAQAACGHFVPMMTPEQYRTRHERRPEWEHADTVWTIAIIVGIFVAGALAGAIAP